MRIYDCPPPTYKAQQDYVSTHLGVIVGQRREDLLLADAAREDDTGFDFPRLASLELARRAALEM